MNMRQSPRRITRLADEIDRTVGTAPLSEILPKVIQLGNAIDDPELVKWARLEYEGYTCENRAMDESVIVPEYRTVPGRYYDSSGNVLHIEDPDLQFVNEDRLRYGVSELEQLGRRADEVKIQNPGMIDIMRKQLNVNLYAFGFSPTSVQGTLSSIRSQLIQRLSVINLPEPTSSDDELPTAATRQPLLVKVSRWLVAETWRIVTGIVIILVAAFLAVYLGISQ